MDINQQWLSNKVKGIYCIENISTKDIYLGSSKDVYTRLHRHKSDLLKNRHSSIILQNSFNKRGLESFRCQILEVVEEDQLLTKREQYWIDKLNPKYNITRLVVRNILSESSRLKISNTLKMKYLIGEIKPTRTSAVDAFDENGIFIHSFKTIKDASIALQVHSTNINKVLSGKLLSVRGLRFRYKYDKISKLDVFKKNGYPKNRASRSSCVVYTKINAYDLNGAFIGSFNSADSCSRELGISSRVIRQRINSDYFSNNDKYIFKKCNNDEPSQVEIPVIISEQKR